MLRKTDVFVTLACLLAVSVSGWTALQKGAPARRAINSWFETRAVKKTLEREWVSLVEGGTPLGANKSKPAAVFFLDFECPFCRKQWREIDSLLDARPDLAVAVRQLPLPIHPGAKGAARAAVCAERQGKFRSMASQLFADSEWHKDRDWVREARRSDIGNIRVFRACLQSPNTDLWLARDSAFASSLHVNATPTTVLPKRIVVGLISGSRLAALLPP